LGEGSAPLPLRVSQEKIKTKSFAQPEIRRFTRDAVQQIFKGFEIDARKLKHKANCQLLFRTPRPPTKGFFSNTRSLTAS